MLVQWLAAFQIIKLRLTKSSAAHAQLADYQKHATGRAEATGAANGGNLWLACHDLR
jgi:hypothetical protein